MSGSVIATLKINPPAGHSICLGHLFSPYTKKGGAIMRIDRILLTVVLTTALVAGAVGSAGTPRKPAAARKPAGAVTFSGTIAAPPEAAEVTWGKGALILRGCKKLTSHY